MLAGLEIADSLEHEVEPGVEGELLEQVVVEAGAGRDPDTPGAVERRAARESASPPSRAGAGRGAARACGDGRRPVERAGERIEQEVVVLTVAHVEAKAVRVHADDDPGAEQRGRERLGLLDRDEEEVRRRGKGLETERAERPRASARAPRSASRRRAGRASPARASAAETFEIGCGAWRRLSSAAVSRSASAYPTRAPASPNDFENVRRTTTPSSTSPAAVTPAYSKYASSTTSGRAAGSSPSSPVGLFGRQQNVTTGSVGADLGSGELRADPVQRIRRLRPRSRRRRPARRTCARRGG